MKSKHFLLLTAFIASFNFSSALAQEPQLLETYDDWNVYVYNEDGNKVCYMASKPAKAEGNYTKRGDVFALITNRPAEGTKNVFSYITGYSYRAGSDATVTIDGKDYMLFTRDDTAWAPDADTDSKLADAVRNGSNMVVKGTSGRGTATTDTFSLKGSTAAHDRITQECSQ